MPPGKKKKAVAKKKKAIPKKKATAPKETKPKRKQGRPPIITQDVVERVAGLLAQYWERYQVKNWLKSTYGVRSEATVDKAITLAREHIHKTCRPDRPIFETLEEAAAFYRKMAATSFYDAERLKAQQCLDQLFGHDAKFRAEATQVGAEEFANQVRQFLEESETATAPKNSGKK